jgi:hypothetical protein
MTKTLLAWDPLPFPQGTSYYAADLADALSVAELFRRVSHFRAHITAEGWRFLWTRYGAAALLEINRTAAWIDADNDTETLEQLTNRSLIAGYDPASDRLRGYFERIDMPEAMSL